MSPRFSSLLLASSCVLFPLHANAAATVEASVSIHQGTIYFGEGLVYDTSGPLLSPAVATASASGGVNHVWGDGETMSFSGSGSAMAYFQYGNFVPFVLRSSASGSLTNTYYDPSNAGMTTVPDGAIPPVYAVQSSAAITDILSYGGTATGYNSRYIFRLSGSIMGTNSFASVFMNHAGNEQSWTVFDSGPYDQMIVSNSFVGGPNLEFSLELLTHFQPNTEYLAEGSSVSGSANFGSTLELIGIDARDINGNLIDGFFTTSGGGTIPIMDSTIPEPSAVLLGAIGMAAGLGMRRRAAR